MKKHNLNLSKDLAYIPMTHVMAQAWILSTKCRHHVRGHGLLRDALEDQS